MYLCVAKGRTTDDLVGEGAAKALPEGMTVEEIEQDEESGERMFLLRRPLKRD